MEVLITLLHENQQSLEDALRLEINYEDVKETKEGDKLYKYLRKRRRKVNLLLKVLKRM